MITVFVITLFLATFGSSFPDGDVAEKMDAIPKALPVWKEPKKIALDGNHNVAIGPRALLAGSRQFPTLDNLVRSIKAQYKVPDQKRPRCFTTAVANCYKALLDRGYDQPSALMMAHENCDPDVCPYCTRPKQEPVWARPVPIPEPPDGAMRCKHRIVATRCGQCWLAKNPL